MFILCPHCQFLVALDPASGQPPERCPRCDARMQAEAPASPSPVTVPDATATGNTSHQPSQPPRTPIEEPLGESPAEAVAKPADGPVDTTADDAQDMAASAPKIVPMPAIDAVAATPPDADIAGDVVLAPVDGIVPAPVATDPDANLTLIASTPTTSTPVFARATAGVAGSMRRRWWAPVAIAGLALLLLLQMLLADRAQLATDSRWRPLLSSLCGALHCSLPPWHEPAAFTLVARDVRAHPAIPGVLRVTATFRNDARWPQPWPGLLLTLSDVDGRAVGARLFAPHEYLGTNPAARGIVPGQVATLTMDVVEPTPRVVAFTFDFR